MELEGYAGRILYVDLTSGSIKKEPLDAKMAEDFIGGFGLALRLGYDIIKPRLDPLSPDNPIVICPGFLNGTLCPGTPKAFALYKSAATGAITLASGGGSLGSMLKWAGYDGVVITGKADKPVYLNIVDDEVEICDADGLWGKGIYDAHEELRKRHGEECSTLCTGPAGENLVKMGIALVDGVAHLGRQMGTIMGSKNLKAMVVYGTTGRKVTDLGRFMKAVDSVVDKAMKDPLRESWVKYALNYVTQGPWITAGIKIGKHETEMITGKEAEETFKMFSMDEQLKHKKHVISCPSCFAADKWAIEFDEGKGHFGLSTPTVDSGSSLGIWDMNQGTKLQWLFNQNGLDMILFLGILDWAIELYERGILTKEDTGGLELKYGSYDLLVKLIEMTVSKEGFGEILAEGYLGAIERIGRGSEKYAVHIKGCFPDFDARTTLGVESFGSVVSPRPSYDMPISGLSVAKGRKPDFMKKAALKMGFPAKVVEEIITADGWDLGRYQAHYEDWGAVFNSFGVCFRMQNSVKYNDPPLLAELYTAATGREITPEQIVKAGERTYNLWRAVNAMEGFSRKDDRFPDRWFEPIKRGEEQLVLRDYFDVAPVSREDVEGMLDAFYEEKGWDVKTGIPTPQKLRELGLDYAARDLEKLG